MQQRKEITLREEAVACQEIKVSKTDTLGSSSATLLPFSLGKRNLYRAIPARLRVIPITEAAGQMITFIRQFLCNETGATAIEYGLIAAGIACAIIAVVSSLGIRDRDAAVLDRAKPAIRDYIWMSGLCRARIKLSQGDRWEPYLFVFFFAFRINAGDHQPRSSGMHYSFVANRSVTPGLRTT